MNLNLTKNSAVVEDIACVRNWVVVTTATSDDHRGEVAVICTSSGVNQSFKALSSTLIEVKNRIGGCLFTVLCCDSKLPIKAVLSAFQLNDRDKGGLSSPLWRSELSHIAENELKETWSLKHIPGEPSHIIVLSAFGSLRIIDMATGALKFRGVILLGEQIISFSISHDNSFGCVITKRERKLYHFDFKTFLQGI